MKTLLQKPGLPLWVELDESTIEYLVSAVAYQCEVGAIKRTHPRTNIPEHERVVTAVPGVSYAYSRVAGYRVQGRYFKDEAAAAAYLEGAATDC